MSNNETAVKTEIIEEFGVACFRLGRNLDLTEEKFKELIGAIIKVMVNKN